jgi:signal transduction histidine kinase
VAEVLAMIRSERLAHDVVAQVQVDESLPYVLGDRVQLQQVLVNRILNACDAMTTTAPADRRLVISGEAHGDGSSELIIADRGPGIAPSWAERIFESFVTSKANGTGLGLAICRKVVALHGGRLWAESSPTGATFHLVLPGAEGPVRPSATALPELALRPTLSLGPAPC